MLTVDNINLYYGAAQALRGVSIAAEPGKVTCVLGRNGVGKTSLLRALVGQYPLPTSPISSPMSGRARASASCRRVVRSFRC